MLKDSPAVRWILGVIAAAIVVAGSLKAAERSGEQVNLTTTAGGEAPQGGEISSQYSPIPAAEPGSQPAGDEAGSSPGPSPTLTGARQPPASAITGPGTYRYRLSTTGEGDQRSETREVTTKVTTLGKVAGETIQEVTVEGADSGRSLVTEVVWRDQGVYVTKFRSGDAECRWQPDFLSHRLPLGSGVAWKADSSCKITSGAQSGDLQRIEESRVTGFTRLDVAGTAVDVWVIERHSVTKAGGATGGFTEEAASTEYYSPAHGLAVRYQSSSTISVTGGGRFAHTRTLELIDLRPA